MKFRRKTQSEPEVTPEAAQEAANAVQAAASESGRPLDAEQVADPSEWVDLGALLVKPLEGRELRLQVEEATHQVQAVLIVGTDGAAELRPFSAARNSRLWDEVRPQVAADMARRGGTATEQEGPFGTELLCRSTVTDEQGRTGQQPSRILGIDGSRWMMMITLMGRPAVEPDNAGIWHDFSGIAVRRGEAAMPPGDALPLVLPEDARRSGPLPT